MQSERWPLGAKMLKLFLPGQNVPAWLQKQEPNNTSYKFGKLTFRNPCFICIKNDSYYVREIIGDGCPLQIKNAENITIAGQSPNGHGGGVVLVTKPILSWLEFILSAFIIINMAAG